jgi:hypothetical protein
VEGNALRAHHGSRGEKPGHGAGKEMSH